MLCPSFAEYLPFFCLNNLADFGQVDAYYYLVVILLVFYIVGAALCVDYMPNIYIQVFVSFNFTIFLGHWLFIKNTGQYNETLSSILLEY